MWSPLLALTSRTSDESTKISPGWPFTSSQECFLLKSKCGILTRTSRTYRKYFFGCLKFHLWSLLLALTSRTQDKSSKIFKRVAFQKQYKIFVSQIHIWHLDTDFTDLQKIFFGCLKFHLWSPLLALTSRTYNKSTKNSTWVAFHKD